MPAQKQTISRRLYAVIALALAVVIFVLLNIAATSWITTAKLDLTANGQFTLAQGTRDIIAKIPEPITLKFYYSRKVAAGYASTQAYAQRVRDLLGEYAALSGGKITVQDIDPERFTDAEDEATGNGLTGRPTETHDTVYFGLVGTNRIDGKEVIPYFGADREQYLEFDLSSLIYRLSQPRKPVLGIITSLPLDTGPGGLQAAMQGNAQPYAIYTELAETYAPKMLDPNANRIPDDVQALMIVHPAGLSAASLYAIDQFVLRGGRALVFVDPNAEIAAPGGGMDPRAGGDPSSDLPMLFQAWGIGYTPAKVVADAKLAMQVQVSSTSVTAYPIWLGLTAEQFDPSDPVTANLEALNLASVGALHPLKGATTHFAALVRSSADAALFDTEMVRAAPRPQDLMGAIHPTGEQFVIAARISGPANSAFINGPPAAMTIAGQPPPAPLPPQMRQSKGPINVVVMADADIFQDRFWVRVEDGQGKRIANNDAFVLNAVENLMGAEDLILLRTRAKNARPFTVVNDMQAQAQSHLQQEYDALQTRVAAVTQRIHELQQGGSPGGQPTRGLSEAQQAEIERFKKELTDTRKALRDVEHNLRKDIDTLGDILAIINIVLVPLLVAGFAILLAWLRRRRRARALAH